ncbi:cyclopropane-fatty-acyl-phospholipid synthase family protein [Anaerobaca lacustris]|uniref:Cyclopropane-fatty-acyl-phospholipid synthase family protein n=1 Tax=Anaerobaca lacustris TaxID=3044600 RepID=A0AAW6U007_9BACT|nr:cyclopropane-fatty-acyl-phospholipid synthase family protein [Sedimentisphaerales bacterium M17dextr]
MTEKIAPVAERSRSSNRPCATDRWLRGIVLGRLEALAWGRITIVEDTWRHAYGDRSDDDAPQVTVTVRSSRFYSTLALGGSVGAAEAYMIGDWSCDDLPGLVRILVRNASVMFGVEGGIARLSEPLLRSFHWLRRNTRTGSRANIHAHYDLGNDFYSLFLDETMTYSCGIFESPSSTLAEASIEKYDRICRKLHLNPADHVIEIGCGWGGFAIHAAGQYGCRVTGTTISQQQYDWATRRVEELGLADRVQILYQDYRDLDGVYDKLVSIEMIEAVGHQYLGRFLLCCSKLLKPDGLMGLQAITILDQQYAQHTRTVDFIKRYIFPGSCLVSVTALCQAATRDTDLRAVHLEDITCQYAETLRRWRKAFFERLDKVKSLGFDDAFVRMWEFYLAYCEGAFEERYIGDVQMVFAKPLYRRPGPCIAPRIESQGEGVRAS